MCQILMFHFLCISKLYGKGKARPRTGHESTDGDWRYSSTFSLTSALDALGG